VGAVPGISSNWSEWVRVRDWDGGCDVGVSRRLTPVRPPAPPFRKNLCTLLRNSQIHLLHDLCTYIDRSVTNGRAGGGPTQEGCIEDEDEGRGRARNCPLNPSRKNPAHRHIWGFPKKKAKNVRPTIRHGAGGNGTKSQSLTRRTQSSERSSAGSGFLNI
jgi:hypothetical protein